MSQILTLPQELERKITTLLYEQNNLSWKRAAVVLSERYRKRDTEHYIASHEDVLSYLALRFPATYAQAYRTFTFVKELIPSFVPTNMLDIGSGPATGVFAAKEIWPSIKDVCVIEKESNFMKIGKQLIEANAGGVTVEWQRSDVTKAERLESMFDVIYLGNILNELDFTSQRQTLAYALHHSRGIIIASDPGTPYGYKAIDAAAQFYKRKDIPLLAPYIQNIIAQKDDYWIHFSQRIKRPEFQRSIRQMQRQDVLAASDWEEVKFAFMVAGSIPLEVHPTVRLLEDPKIVKGYLEVLALTEQGIEIKKILKRDKEIYQIYRKLRRGDIVFH